MDAREQRRGLVTRIPRVRAFFRSRTWLVLRFLIGVALGVAALDAINGKRGELSGASAQLANLRLPWLFAAIGAEVLSYASWGQLQRRLLLAGGVTITRPYSFGISLGAGAIANSLPGGTGFASLYSFRYYRRSGAEIRVAAWTLAATIICTSLALCILASVGVFLAFGQSSNLSLVGVILTVLVLAIIADAVMLQRRWLYSGIAFAMVSSRRLTRHPRARWDLKVRALEARLSSIQMGWLSFFDTLVSSLGVWAFDCAALAASFAAVGVHVPWRGLLLTYGASQLAVNLPITPGGLGVVEGTMTIALVAFGGAEHDMVPAVLCYRIVSFWGFLPVGWLGWAVMALVGRRQAHAAAEVEAEVATELSWEG